ncbi:MAG TPA: peptidase [Chryseosolibacter sp.]
MNRSFYYFGIFLSALLVAMVLFQSLIYLEIGGHMYTLKTFPAWFLLGGVVSLSYSVTLLKYYHTKQYNIVFWAALTATIAGLCHSVIIYIRLMAWTGGDHYLITAFLAMTTSILYGASLIFSDAGERLWLKAGGAFTLIFYLLIMLSLIWGMNSHEVMANGTVERIHQWVGVAGSFLPLFFMANFLTEIGASGKEDKNLSRSKSWETLMITIGITAIVAALYLAPALSTERNSISSWINRGPERAEELAKPFEAGRYVNSKGQSLQYRLMKPLDYDSEKKYPLVVCLHGGGGWGTDNVKQVEGSWMAQLLSTNDNRRDYPAFLLVPQCPPGFSWGGVPMHPGVDSLVFEIMSELESEFSIDANRRYVTGESLGGYGTWHFISTRPEMFAAAIPICGIGNPDLAKNVVNVPIWAFHGAKDRNVPVRGSSDMIKAIRDAGGNPKYNEYPDGGHNIIDQVNRTPGLLEWLFTQKRDSVRM